MTHEEFEKQRKSMNDSALIALAELQIHRLAETYGESHTMSIPPKITDTDIILSELLRRYKLKKQR